ncbi:MBL fold metallo-hydrolase [Dactylosporangium sp. AC04546]|uniref:MBL fold metallo-hydrolase n=1 Tax=Dactylosporangium sp. AC04546 TaxID=2862460 RepID=UPI001EDCCD8F|nr:MBL fold metallo-hydrolase [Dactylosporangium sp. AC04546]WVK79536.1 MBL fold metallo-hydrolase [Dactylosporangium sp. AC04546]
MSEKVQADDGFDDNPLPREIVPGVFWLGACFGGRNVYKGTVLHSYNSVYLVVGDDACAIVEGGHPANFPYVEQQLEDLLARGLPPVKYIFPTHQEVPHSGGLGRFLQRFPDAVACGHMAEYHLVFPQYEDRFREMEIGESVELGGTSIDVLEAPFRDYIYTRWFFDSRRKVLFSGDGFAYSHYHGAGHCGKSAEETPELALPEMTALYGEKAFWWTQFVDIEPYITRLEWLLDDIGAEVLAPTHGLPILDMPKTLPELIKGMRLMPKEDPDRPAFGKHEVRPNVSVLGF